MYHEFDQVPDLAGAQGVHAIHGQALDAMTRLDFGRPFLPEGLARARSLGFLHEDEQRTLNQIRAHAYLCIFTLVEDFALPFVLDHARPQLQQDDQGAHALLEFAAAKAGRIRRFEELREAFESGFGHHCEVVGPATSVVEYVLSQHPLAVALATRHFERMVRRHRLEVLHDDQELDLRFSSLLLRPHPRDACRHARPERLIVDTLAARATSEDLRQATDGYRRIGTFIDDALDQQVEYDRYAFQTYTGRRLGESERSQFRDMQLQANRWTYLGAGMTHSDLPRSSGHAGTESHIVMQHAGRPNA